MIIINGKSCMLINEVKKWQWHLKKIPSLIKRCRKFDIGFEQNQELYVFGSVGINDSLIISFGMEESSKTRKKENFIFIISNFVQKVGTNLRNILILYQRNLHEEISEHKTFGDISKDEFKINQNLNITIYKKKTVKLEKRKLEIPDNNNFKFEGDISTIAVFKRHMIENATFVNRLKVAIRAGIIKWLDFFDVRKKPKYETI
jgi:hypothetical protein